MAHKNVDYKPEDIQFPNQKIVQSELVHEMQSAYVYIRICAEGNSNKD